MFVDVSKWPLILCGPILRRVEINSVSVFIALRFKRKISMTVFACDSQGKPTTTLGGNAVETRQFGRRLHAAVVTVTGLTLSPLQLCAYDLSFDRISSDPEDIGPSSSSLQSLGLLGGDTPLGYEEGLKPTFRVPSHHANALEFIHASCRKLHGEGKDAFPHIDEVIKGLRLHKFKRPQMMLLTGDQIYADDVAGPLSPVLTEVGNALLGWSQEEYLPLSDGDVDLSGCWPGLRHIVVNQAGFKAGTKESACHLLGLGEYYAMYLLAWSFAIWPQNLPTPEAVYPADTIKDGKGTLASLGSLSPSLPSLLSWSKSFVGSGEVWRTQVTELENNIKPTLPAVRRLMANVPIFMMFDDHEVTDDWNFDRGWHERIYTNPLGSRIIGNALSAYAVFQAWGNDPLGEFSDDKPGGKLLSALEAIGKLDGSTYNQNNQTYKQTHELVRVAPISTTSGITWDYTIEWGDYRLIVLDTRTRRDIAHEGQADLMLPTELDRQIAKRATSGKALTLVLSPAPVIGHPFHERVIGRYGGKINPKYIDRESWWNEARGEAFEGILDFLSSSERVIILSGDVHYGFTAAVRYWNERPGRTVRATVVQLCSSALKNEDWKTKALGAAGTRTQELMLKTGGTAVGLVIGAGAPFSAMAGALAGGTLADAVIPAEREDYVGWSTGPITLIQANGTRLPVLTKPPVCRLKLDVAQNADKAPEWCYRVGFAIDLQNGRGELAPVPPASPRPSGFLDRKVWLAQEQRVTTKNDSDRIVVGRNNFGTVTIFGEPPHLAVMHKLWFRPEGQPILPYTSHFALLDTPDKSEISPFSPNPDRTKLPDLSAWAELMSFRPSAELQGKVRQLNLTNPREWFFHRIESGWGPINLDYYGVRIDKMPTSLPDDTQGTVRTVSIEELCQFVRHNLLDGDLIVNPLLSKFRPYGAADKTAWLGDAANALSALISIRIPGNDGTVMCTESSEVSWTFSTVNSPDDGPHPVSGNRRFGVVLADDSKKYVYTLGADRCTDFAVGETALDEAVWFGAHKLWQSFQSNVMGLINKHGGVSQTLSPISRRYDWSDVMSAYFSPTGNWQI